MHPQQPIVVRLSPRGTSVRAFGAASVVPRDPLEPLSVAAVVGRTLAERDFFEGLEASEVAVAAEAYPHRRHPPKHTPPRRPSCKARQLRAERDLDLDDDLRIIAEAQRAHGSPHAAVEVLS